MNLIDARNRAAKKFDQAQNLMADREGVEQATGTLVAQHKASRFASLDQVADLCCGIGGDAMELAQVTNVTAFDIDPTRVWMAQHNAQCNAREVDVTLSSAHDLLNKFSAWHIDPSRRIDGKRLWTYADLIPGDETIRDLSQQLPHAAIKLGPGINFEELPLIETDEVEIIGDGRRLYEATWWRGEIAHHPGQRTATNLTTGCSFSSQPRPPQQRSQPGVDEILIEADPALERAELVGCLPEQNSYCEIAPGLGLLTSNTALDSPWLHCYHVVHLMPWRPRNVRLWLQKNQQTVSAVRTRGKAVDPDKASATLPMGDQNAIVLFVLRLGKKLVAVMTKPAINL